MAGRPKRRAMLARAAALTRPSRRRGEVRRGRSAPRRRQNAPGSTIGFRGGSRHGGRVDRASRRALGASNAIGVVPAISLSGGRARLAIAQPERLAANIVAAAGRRRQMRRRARK